MFWSSVWMDTSCLPDFKVANEFFICFEIIFSQTLKKPLFLHTSFRSWNRKVLLCKLLCWQLVNLTNLELNISVWIKLVRPSNSFKLFISRLVWVPGHSEITGNCKADQLVRGCTLGTFTAEWYRFGSPMASCILALEQWISRAPTTRSCAR